VGVAGVGATVGGAAGVADEVGTDGAAATGDPGIRAGAAGDSAFCGGAVGGTSYTGAETFISGAAASIGTWNSGAASSGYGPQSSGGNAMPHTFPETSNSSPI
jgi:hypothetical protein